MKVLILGATGMLAKPVINHFYKKGFDLRLFSRSIEKSGYPEKFEIVKGDIFNNNDLLNAMDGCDAVHINLGKVNEAEATENIVKVCKQNNIQLISYISGCTVSEEHRWFWMIDNKFKAENAIIKSGIDFIIFRPTWFFESLKYNVRNGKVTLMGKNQKQYHWIAAEDYGRMVAEAYIRQEARNKIFYIYGKEKHTFKELISEYCKQLYPEIKKISTVPLSILKLISKLTGKKELKMAAELFSYFEKVDEPEITDEAYKVLGEPQLNFQKWLETQK
ncbi:SDR family oxidoreductase [Bacteroidota bacterium]